jgi:beta-N-acetylhexosaminidase
MPRPTGAQVARRRVAAVAVAAAATFLIWLLLIREDGAEEGASGVDVTGEVPAAVRDLVAEMGVEEKVNGVLLLGFEGTDRGAPIVDELRARELGGVLVTSRNWVNSVQLGELLGDLRAAGSSEGLAPPLLAVSQEGGPYRALPDQPPAERQLDIGDAGNPRLAQDSARTAGVALAKLGFDLNLFPVADVAPLDSPIADRAYSDDPEVAAALTAAATRGCRMAGIACAPKHFPGLGAASQDTGEGPATVGLDEISLQNRDLPPFEAAFAEGAPAVVLSHAFYTAYDPVTPASLSPLVTFELLRERLGFQGVAITDDLAAGAIVARGAAAETGGGAPAGGSAVTAAAVAALQAGADMLMISEPEDQAGVADAVLEAVAAGELPEERLDEAVGRVLLLKQQMGLLNG